MLQSPYAKGGLNLPNFRLHYLASQFCPLWLWLHSKNSDMRWVSIDQHEMKITPVTVISGHREEAFCDYKKLCSPGYL